MLHFTFQNMRAFYGPWPPWLGLKKKIGTALKIFCFLTQGRFLHDNYINDNIILFVLKPGLGKHSFQKNATFLRSFAFFSKECNILAFFCVFYKKNAAFFAFFYVLYKRMRCSLHSFLFFIKERGILCALYKRTRRSLRSFTFFIKERGVLCVLLRSL